jgi:hypothetical protein
MTLGVSVQRSSVVTWREKCILAEYDYRIGAFLPQREEHGRRIALAEIRERFCGHAR